MTSGPLAVRMVVGSSSKTQSPMYFTPAPASSSGVSKVCVRPGPSQPIGRLPVKRSRMSIVRWIIAALVFVLVDRHLVVGVAHELPAFAPRLLRDAGIVLADARIDGERRPDALLPKQIEEAPDPDPHAVFVPGPVRDVRQQRNSGRRRQQLTGHRTADVPDLEVDDRPQHKPRTVGQLEGRSVDDCGEVAPLARNHGFAHRWPLVRAGKIARTRLRIQSGEGEPGSALRKRLHVTNFTGRSAY